MTSPRDAGLQMPSEWSAHAATWVAWPSHADLWQANLAGARAAFTRLTSAIAEGETVEVLVADDENERLARSVLPERNVRFHRLPFGDIWLRDTGPIFLCGRDGEVATLRCAFNGWGGKYVLEHDDQVAQGIASIVGLPAFTESFVLEGGSIDVDGEGSVLTTRQCLLNPNRNGAVNELQVEQVLGRCLGIERVLWLDEGLLHDHTDGHVDTLARFVRPALVVAMEPRGSDDPNRETLRATLKQLSVLRDARGRSLDVVRIPSPGLVKDRDGQAMPASYANFYVANSCVVVPTYASPWDDEAVEQIGELFPGRKPVGVDARAILSGGGAFHCITQQQPKGALR